MGTTWIKVWEYVTGGESNFNNKLEKLIGFSDNSVTFINDIFLLNYTFYITFILVHIKAHDMRLCSQ